MSAEQNLSEESIDQSSKLVASLIIDLPDENPEVNLKKGVGCCPEHGEDVYYKRIPGTTNFMCAHSSHSESSNNSDRSRLELFGEWDR